MFGIRGFRPGRRFRAARCWSNSVLRQIAPLFKGDVVNVSGWRDEDKEGGLYRDYFSAARSYRVTNFGGFRGESANTTLRLDLEKDLPQGLNGCADVVFNHTTLEHVIDMANIDGSQNYRIIMRYTAGVQFGVGQDIVYYGAY